MAKRVFSVLICVVISVAIFACGDDGFSASDYFYVDINHIIDARTGLPYSVTFNEQTNRFENTTSHIISATIISESSLEGDAYATAVCVMGVERGKEFILQMIQQGKIQSALLFTNDKKMLVFGDIVAFNADDSFSLYKEYELVYGELSSQSNHASEPLPTGSYSRYNRFVFAETMELEIHIFGESAQAKDALEAQIMQRISLINNQVNITLEGSDIYRLNAASAGERVSIGFDTYTLLSESKRIYSESDGAFNVAVTPLSRLWQVDIEGIARYNSVGSVRYWTQPDSLPTLESVFLEQSKIDLNELTLISEEGEYFAIKGIDGLEIDLGGVAKGYAVDVARDILLEGGMFSAQINLSGNIYQLGNYFDSTALRTSTWKIGVTDPNNKHSLIKGIVLAFESEGSCSIVTSGDYERFYSFGYEI